MPVERRGQVICVMVNLANWQQEEPTGYGGGRRLSMDDTSRVNREVYARFCERLGVQFPRPTRRRSAMIVPTATRIRLESWFGLLRREIHAAHQILEARIGAQGIEREVCPEAIQQVAVFLVCGVEPLEGMLLVA